MLSVTVRRETMPLPPVQRQAGRGPVRTCARERHFELLDGTVLFAPEDGRGEVRRDRHPDTCDPPSS